MTEKMISLNLRNFEKHVGEHFKCAQIEAYVSLIPKRVLLFRFDKVTMLQPNFEFFGEFPLPEGVFRHFWTLLSPDSVRVKFKLSNKAKLRVSEQFGVFLIKLVFLGRF